MSTHIDHLRVILQVMRENTLFAKRSKCVFGTTQVEYLGHVISAKGGSNNPSKIKAMQEWPVPTTIKQLRGFLGLTGYYRSPKAQKDFEKLQHAMMQSPILALPNFDQEFVIETDASGFGIRAELLAVVLALQNWRGYLLDRHFKSRTDHFSLKYVLDQRLTTPFQSKWLPKLLGFDYEIEYKKGTDNKAADALSRIKRQGALFTLLAGISNGLMDAVKTTWSTDLSDQLRRKDKWVVGKDLELRKKLVAYFHGSAVGGHLGVQATTKRLTTYFYWKGLRKMVKEKK
ncbi:putative mitochondrial protein [Tanacetum coccineum]